MGNVEEKKLKKVLQEYASPSPLLEKRAVAKVLALREIEKKPLIQGKPKGQRLCEQAAYISPVTWILQGVLFLYMLRTVGEGSHLWTISSMVPLIGIVAGCELIRSYGHNMWELELSCRYNLRSIFALKLLILGSVDLVILIMAVAACGMGHLKFTLIVVLILVPFNLSNSLYLWMIIKLHRKCTNYLLAGTGIFLSVSAHWLNALASEKFFVELMAKGLVPAVMLLSSLGLLIVMGILLLHCSGKGDKKWSYI